MQNCYKRTLFPLLFDFCLMQRERCVIYLFIFYVLLSDLRMSHNYSKGGLQISSLMEKWVVDVA